MPYTLKANLVWIEGASTESKPSFSDGARDGHVLNEFDTGKQWLRRYGEWVDADLGLSFIGSSRSGQATSDADGLVTIAFAIPFVGANYSITFGIQDAGSPGNLGIPYYYDLTINGFKVITRSTAGGVAKAGVTFSWFATLYFNP